MPLILAAARRIAIFLLICSAAALRAQTIPGSSLPDSLPPLDSLPRATVRAYADEVSALAATLKTYYADQTRQAVDARRLADRSVRAVRADSTVARDSVRQLEQALRARRDAEKEAARIEKLAAQVAAQAARVAKLDSVQQPRQLPRVFYSVRTLAYRANLSAVAEPAATDAPDGTVAEPPPADQPVAAAEAPAGRPAVAAMMTRPPKGYRTYNPGADVLLNPPAAPCTLAVNLRDEFSGEWRRELAPEELFRASRPGRDATLAQPGVIADAYLGAAGPAVALYLAVRVYDPPAGAAAGRRLGGMPRGGLAMIKFLDGSTVSLSNLRGDDGVPDPNGGGFTTYRGQYALDAAALKKIRKTGVDKLRIAWNAGYEDYDVHHVDLLVRQVRCLLD